MWQLRYVIVRGETVEIGPGRPAAKLAGGLSIPAMPPVTQRSVARGITEESHNEIIDALSEEWEPFAVTSPSLGITMIWFRRYAKGEPPSVDELPGQYV